MTMAAQQTRVNSIKAQIAALTDELREIAATPNPTNAAKNFDFTRWPQRKIALLFSYEGWHYSGLNFQNTPTPIPTVEGKLFEALIKTRLVPDSLGLESSNFTRCGRTDRGVSASGQVVSLWIRSNLPPDRLEGTGALPPGEKWPRLEIPEVDGQRIYPRRPPEAPKVSQNLQTDTEFDYPRLLNRILPPSIRILAWSPVTATYDSRFSCLSRHYKYFFSSRPSQPLDIARMEEAAQFLIGEHDFRNFCKVDASKQVDNYRRNVITAFIEKDTSTTALSKGEERYIFNLRGTAFLYHQVRHIMAVLFMVGAREEDPDVVLKLLDVETMPTKPVYEMANDLPLLLWQCEYAPGAVKWIKDSSEAERVHLSMYPPAIQHSIREQHLSLLDSLSTVTLGIEEKPGHQIQLGCGEVARSAKGFVPLERRQRTSHFSEINRLWREAKEAKIKKAAQTAAQETNTI